MDDTGAEIDYVKAIQVPIVANNTITAFYLIDEASDLFVIKALHALNDTYDIIEDIHVDIDKSVGNPKGAYSLMITKTMTIT